MEMSEQRAAAVVVDRLTKRYRSASSAALDGVSFEVGAGEFFALLGPNGAGKSTCVSILTTTLAPTSGSVRIAGHDLRAEPAAVRQRVGVIFQNPSLDLNLSGEENIRLHAVLYGLFPYRPAYRLMPRAYRQLIASVAPALGVEGDLFRPARTLSGGTRRKLEIMRALLHQPDVLFLDEPTTGLDATSRRGLWTYLADIRQRRATTIVLTTHYLDEAEAAGRILILDHGRVVTQGSPAQLKQRYAGAALTLDAPDHDALRRELAALGVTWEELDHPESLGGPARVRIPLRAPTQAHDLARALTTPLTLIQTQQASLEEVYLRILAGASDGHDGRDGGDARDARDARGEAGAYGA